MDSIPLTAKIIIGTLLIIFILALLLSLFNTLLCAFDSSKCIKTQTVIQDINPYWISRRNRDDRPVRNEYDTVISLGERLLKKIFN